MTPVLEVRTPIARAIWGIMLKKIYSHQSMCWKAKELVGHLNMTRVGLRQKLQASWRKLPSAAFPIGKSVELSHSSQAAVTRKPQNKQ